MRQEGTEGTERPATASGRRIDEIFGRDLGTEDRGPDADDGTTGGEDRAREQWYRENRPPHHDDHRC